MSRLVFVIAAEGREVPIPPSEAAAAGGTLVRIRADKGADGKPKRFALPWTTYTRKRIAAGDLILVDADGKPAKDRHAAAAPADVKAAPDGSVDADQRPDAVINAEAAAKSAAADKRAELERAKSSTTPKEG